MTRDDEAVAFAAETLAEQLFGSHLQANMLLIGAAYQHGCLPLRADAIERAIELNGASVEANIAAFRWGRAAVARPDLLPARGRSGTRRRRGPQSPARTLAELLERYEAELTAYQDAATRTAFAADVQSVAATVAGAPRQRWRRAREGLRRRPLQADGLQGRVRGRAAAPRLVEQARLHAEFGDDARVKVLLHPPLLRALGMKRKLRIGRSAVPMFRVLRGVAAAARHRARPVRAHRGAARSSGR